MWLPCSDPANASKFVVTTISLSQATVPLLKIVNLSSAYKLQVQSPNEADTPAEIISHALWLYLRFAMSYVDVDEILAARGVAVTYEAIRQ